MRKYLNWAINMVFLASAICGAQESSPFSGLATLHPEVATQRASSSDRSGGNADFVKVVAGPLCRLQRSPAQVKFAISG